MRSALQRKAWHVDFFLLFVFLLGLSLPLLEEWVMSVGRWRKNCVPRGLFDLVAQIGAERAQSADAM